MPQINNNKEERKCKCNCHWCSIDGRHEVCAWDCNMPTQIAEGRECGCGVYHLEDGTTTQGYCQKHKPSSPKESYDWKDKLAKKWFKLRYKDMYKSEILQWMFSEFESLLSSQRRELIEKVESMRTIEVPNVHMGFPKMIGYNRALDDVLKIINDK